MQKNPRFKLYWRRNSMLIAVLLLVWFLITFVPFYFARSLGHFFLFGWPFSFWMAAFGAPTFFLIIVGFYAWRMDGEDKKLRKNPSGSASGHE